LPKRTSFPDAPTAGDITGLYQIRLNEGDEAKLRTRARRARELTELEHSVTIPAEYRAIAKEIRTPFVRDTWLRVCAALTRDTPVASVEPRDITEPAREAANVAERFFLAMLSGMSRERGEDLLYEDAKALVRDQESVIKCVHKPDAWANFPKRSAGEPAEAYDKKTEGYKKRAPLLFAARVVDRMSMLFGDGEYGDDWALEYGEYPQVYLKSRYKMAEESGDGSGYYVERSSGGEQILGKRRRLVDPKSPEVVLGGRPAPEGELATSSGGMSTKVEYWDSDWWCVVIDGTMAPGFPKRNPYAPLLPYFRAKSDPVLFALSFLVPGFDSLLTMWLNWAYIGAYPTPILEAPDSSAPNIGDIGADLEPAGGDNQRAPAIYKPGLQTELPPGYSLKFAQPPPIGQDVQQMAQIYRQLIETAGVASVLRGAAGSDHSGYLANQLMSAATLTYRHLGSAIETQLAEMGEFMWHVISRHIKQEVYVLATEGKPGREKKHWLGLKPDGRMSNLCAPIDLLARMEVKLRPVLPTDEQARAMIGNQANAARLLPKRRVLEKYYQEEDPEGLLDELAVEEALDNDPMLKALQTEEALRKAGYLPQAGSGLLGPNGQPMPPSGGGGMNPMMMPPGQAAGGLPGIPGLTQPMIPGPPPAPNGVPGAPGGRAPGAYPGLPGGPQL
jgi:hypothetical protein